MGPGASLDQLPLGDEMSVVVPPVEAVTTSLDSAETEAVIRLAEKLGPVTTSTVGNVVPVSPEVSE